MDLVLTEAEDYTCTSAPPVPQRSMLGGCETCEVGAIGSTVRDDRELESLVSEFRSSQFLQYVAKQVHLLQLGAVRRAEFEVTRLRTENERLRAQFARSCVELPGRLLHEDGKRERELTPTGSSKTVESRLVRVVPGGESITRRVQAAPQESNRLGVMKANNDGIIRSSITTSLSEQLETIFAREKSRATAWITAAHDASDQPKRVATRSNSKSNAIFADKELMKEQVRLALKRKPRNLADYYQDSGWCQYVAKSQIFEYVTLWVISANAIWIALDADLNDAAVLTDADPVFIVVENLFCIYFIFEWLIRLVALRVKRDGLKDSWFLFDGVLVALMIVETWMMTILFAFIGTSSSSLKDASILKVVRITKITRMARMGRLLRAWPELTVLIKGIWVAARSVFFTILLLTVIVYVFAVAFRQATDGSEVGKRHFPSVPQAMKSLLLRGILPDLSDYVESVGSGSLFLAFGMMIFILLASLTVMNMLIGILVEVVSVVSSVENEQMKVNYVKYKLLRLLDTRGMDTEDEDILITRNEFENMLTEPAGAMVISDIGVDPVGLVDFGDFIFKDAMDGKITFQTFIEVMLQFRGTNTCTVKDIVDFRKVVITELHRTEASLARAFKQLGVHMSKGRSTEMRTRGTEVKSDPRRLEIMKQRSCCEPGHICVKPAWSPIPSGRNSPEEYEFQIQDSQGESNVVQSFALATSAPSTSSGHYRLRPSE